MFWMDKGRGIIETSNSGRGSINLIGKLLLADDDEIPQIVCLKSKIKITKTNGENEGLNIIILYGTDLTELESRLVTLESNEEDLTIEKVNDINPYFEID
jgi:hypothetical protein